MANPNELKSEQKTKSKLVENEEKVLEFWNKNQIFKKSLDKEAPMGEFVFYDGPPFATGTPHYGHILAGTIKDVLPRYKTMRGYHVPRRWGWDCHGLPVENVVEKELNLASKKDIENYGIEKFNEMARKSVMQFADVWRHQVPRLGRWVDMDNDYRTMDTGFTESVWWIFKRLHEKSLIYEGFKSMHLCPHCETTLSNFEVNQGYKDIADISVYVKFEIIGEPMTYFLAWTTTPWTLPGNVSLAVGPGIEYVKIISESSVKGEGGEEIKKTEQFILGKARAAEVFAGKSYEVVGEMKGSDLVGKSYKPLFDYYSKDETLLNLKNGWKVYPASFVTTEDGTGIVHIAPAFGDDDMNLGKEFALPFIQHVGTNGKFKKEVRDFPHADVKPKDDHQKTDIDVIKYLAHAGTLFDKKKFIHSYPHCWRCDTPLLNYAASSWFVKVTDFKDKLVKANKKTSWVPSEIRDGRFGNWLSGARDWAISRSRFWGAPIPVWKSEEGEVFVPGNLHELQTRTKAKNRYIIMRHGEAANNIKCVLSSSVEGNPHPLTELGKEQVRAQAELLKGKGIQIIVYSPVRRTKETAEMVGKTLGIGAKHMISDIRLREVGFGDLDGKSVSALAPFPTISRFTHPLPGGESYQDISKRVSATISDLELRFSGQTILIVTHDALAWLLCAAAQNLSPEETVVLHDKGKNFFFKNAEARELIWRPLPRNREGKVDLHRPYIDEVVVYSENGKPMKRVPEVFDCWFESGAMPYAEACYTGSPKSHFNPVSGIFSKSVGFPADFIAEGLDQTRGWFYSMLVLGVALFNKSPFKNVIVNGIVLAENGEKMSKRLKNYPDPMNVVNMYGADALRYYLLSSPVVSAEDLRFTEKGVDDIAKKLLQRLDNVLSFYSLYAGDEGDGKNRAHSENVLDKWILARLNETAVEMTKRLELYELDKAARPLMDFVDDLSTWYLRRSRDRFKSDNSEDKHNALDTIRFVLCEISKLMAPFTPFFAEYLYQVVKHVDSPESVHLNAWPIYVGQFVNDTQLISEMKEVRKIVTLGLEARSKAKINVRQPLKSLKLKMKDSKFNSGLIGLIKDEVNIKEVIVDEKISNEVELDINLTDELRLEGDYRDLVRAIQDTRKVQGFKVGEMVKLTIDATGTANRIVDMYSVEIKKSAQLSEINLAELLLGTEIKVGEITLKIKLDR